MSMEALGSVDLAVRGRIVAPGRDVARGEVRIRDGVVVEVVDAPVGGDVVIDVDDSLVLPGAVDAHVHCLSYLDEGIEATTRAAAAGGVTTVIDMPFDADEPIWSPEVFERKRDKIAVEAHVDTALLATVHRDDGAGDVAPLAEAGACGFKLSIFDTDPYRFPRIPDVELLDVLRAISRTGLRACVHAENDEIIKPLIERAKAAGETDAGAHLRTRPPVSETDGVLKVLEFAHSTHARVHLCHLSLGRSVALTQWYKDQGTDVTCETCTHYLTFIDRDVTSKGSTMRINPPMRTAEDRDALWAAVAEGGIDLVSSDHVGWPRELKTQASIFDNKSGAPGIENLLAMTVSQGLNGRKVTPHRLATVLADRPAQLFGLSGRKGRIAEGYDADLAVWDPSSTVVIDEASLQSRAGWSPYHGIVQNGRVQMTIGRGAVIFDGDEVCSTPGTGRFLHPEASGAGTAVMSTS
jgi:allantoinase